MDDNRKLKKIYFEEAADLLADVESNLLLLEGEPGNKELIDSIFRSVHTLKGSGSLFDLKNINDVSHALEDLLDELRSKDYQIGEESIGIIFKSLDLLKILFESEKKDKKDQSMDVLTLEIIKLIKSISAKKQDNKPQTKLTKKVSNKIGEADSMLQQYFQTVRDEINNGNKIYFIDIRLKKGCLKEGLDPLVLFRNLQKLGKIIGSRSRIRNIPSLEHLKPEVLYLNEIKILHASSCEFDQIDDIFEFAYAKGKIKITELPPSLIEQSDDKRDEARQKFLGELLVEDGILSEEDVERALKDQERPIGRILVDEGKISSRQLEKALEKQQSMGVAPQVSVRVNAQKLDSLVDLVGELVISHSLVMQNQIIKGIEDQQFNSNLSQLGKVIGDLQNQIMALRMIPISHTFGRMKRLVRDTSVKLNKQIEFRISGEDTEIDKNVIDDLNEILVHLVRNSIDHGIETPQSRKALGKEPIGLIELNAFPKGGNIVIEIKDDGHGISRQKIIERAKSKGLDIEIENESHLYQLIFEPGFSTASEVTSVSGRGVGLDVVKRKLEAIRGKVDVLSQEGKGTTFTLTLQPTLAIIDGMVFKVGSERMIVPTLSIEESMRPSREQVITIEGSGEAVMIRGKVYPLIRLHSIFSIDTSTTKPWEALVMLARSQGRQCVILIDELVGQQQVVVKSLGSRFQKIKAISGGAILGDGRVGLILDLDGLMDSVLEHSA